MTLARDDRGFMQKLFALDFKNLFDRGGEDVVDAVQTAAGLAPGYVQLATIPADFILGSYEVQHTLESLMEQYGVNDINALNRLAYRSPVLMSKLLELNGTPTDKAISGVVSTAGFIGGTAAATALSSAAAGALAGSVALPIPGVGTVAGFLVGMAGGMAGGMAAGAVWSAVSKKQANDALALMDLASRLVESGQDVPPVVVAAILLSSYGGNHGQELQVSMPDGKGKMKAVGFLDAVNAALQGDQAAHQAIINLAAQHDQTARTATGLVGGMTGATVAEELSVIINGLRQNPDFAMVNPRNVINELAMRNSAFLQQAYMSTLAGQPVIAMGLEGNYMLPAANIVDMSQLPAGAMVAPDGRLPQGAGNIGQGYSAA